jgi:hypothetical protein
VEPHAGGDEGVDLGQRAHGTGDAAADLPRERPERLVAPAAEDQVVRRCAQRAGGRLDAVLDEPELVDGVERRVVAQCSGEAEDQVVPRLVREQRCGSLEEDARVGRLDDLHARSLRCLGDA